MTAERIKERLGIGANRAATEESDCVALPLSSWTKRSEVEGFL